MITLYQPKMLEHIYTSNITIFTSEIHFNITNNMRCDFLVDDWQNIRFTNMLKRNM